MSFLLLAVFSLALTKGLPKEKEMLMPHTSASPAEESGSREKLIMLGANMAKKKDKDIRIVRKDGGYVLQIRHANLPAEEYELASDKPQGIKLGL